jgi:hypothetical protein
VATDPVELISEFVELADDISANPAVKAGLQSTLSFVADPPGSGKGTWSLSDPDEIGLKALLLDLRNLTQASSDLHFDKVLDAIEVAVPDAEARKAVAETRARLGDYEEAGITTVNGRPMKPAEVVRRTLYSSYHHRDLSKRRAQRQTPEFERLVNRMEFMEWVRNVCGEVAYIRYQFIPAAKAAGYLDSIVLREPTHEGEKGPDP